MPIPSSIDAERALLGTLIRDSLPFPADLSPADFAEPNHQDIAQALRDLEAQGTARDENTVTTFLRDVRSLVSPVYVNELTNIVGFSSYNPAWAVEVRRQSALRAIYLAAHKAIEHVAKPGVEPDLIADFLTTEAERICKRTAAKTDPQRMDLADLENFKREADPTNVLGNRWLCKGGSLVMAGQAGTGKSALMMQAAINWTLGKDFFGIATEGGMKMRTLVIQAENDAGDVAESMQDQIHSLGLSQDERAELKERLHIYREAVATGAEFGRVLKKLVIEHQATICFVDPLMAYVGADISEAAEAAKFLRHIIQPILNETGVIIVFMHHTGKPKSAKDKEGQTAADLAYNLFGSSEVTNWAREIACLMRCPGDEQIYRFGLTKRRGRAGMTDINGDKAGEIYIQHSPNRGEIRWVRSNPPMTYDQMGS